MEALIGLQVALATVYDMCKAVDRGMTMTDIRLLEKRGGEVGRLARLTGRYVRDSCPVDYTATTCRLRRRPRGHVESRGSQ